VHGHGTRKRHAIIDAVKKWFLIDRFLCTACGKTFTLLPDFMLPFKHYTAADIEEVLRHLFGGGKLGDSSSRADDRTLRRWWKEFSQKLPQWAGLLEAQVFKLFNRTPSFIETSSLPLTKLQKVLSQLPTLPSRWTVLVKSLWWLNPTHPLCLP
jgi:transposase-like protein